MKPALGMIETRGLTVLTEAVDAMLKAANVSFRGWEPVGSGLVTAFVEGDVADVKSATDVGAEAAGRIVAAHACMAGRHRAAVGTADPRTLGGRGRPQQHCGADANR